MGFETGCLFDFINVEGMFDHALEVSAHQLATGGEHQPIIAQRALGTGGVAIAHLLEIGIDALCRALHEIHSDRVEQPVQRGRHRMDVRLVETRPDAQLCLGRQDSNLHIVAIMLVQQAGRAQGAPYPTETCANYQNMLFHDVLPKTKSIR